MRTDPLNFDLRVTQAGSTYEVISSGPDVGEATAPFRLPFPDNELRATVDRLAAASADGQVSDTDRDMLVAFGKRMFEALFSGEVYAAFRRQLDAAARDGRRLRVRLRFAEPALVDLPWEFLYFPERRVYLAADRETPLVRYLELPEPATALPITLPLEVLVVAPSPVDLPRLDVAAEQRRLERALGPLITSGDVRLRWVRPPTLDGLGRALDAAPVHVLHFAGHGGWDDQRGIGVLEFEAEDGRAAPTRADLVADAIRGHPSVRLVVLNACEGARAGPQFAGTGQALVGAGIPAVIAMQFVITDDAAVTLAGALYRAIADGEAVDLATATARHRMRLAGHDLEWATPVLYLRSPDAHLFDLGSGVMQPPVPPRIATVATGDVVVRNETRDGVRLDRSTAIAAQRRYPVRRPPADFPGLLGRDAVVGAIRAALAEDSVEVYGARGTGKSALLRHLANRLPAPDEDFVHIRAVGRPLEDLAQRLFEEFYVEQDPPLRPSEAQLRSYLGAIDGLVVLDDIELPSDELDALLDTAPACRFLLASEERRLSGAGRSRHLPGLDATAGEQLIARDLGRPLAPAEAATAAAIVAAARGSPGAILQLIAPVREGVASLAEIGDRIDRPTRDSVADDSGATQVAQVRGLLLALGAAPLSADHVATLVGPEVDVAGLERRAVIASNSPRYTLVTEPADDPRVARSDPAAPTVSSLYELLPTLSSWAEHTRDDPERLVEDAEAIIAALRWAAAGRRWGAVLRLARAAEDALFTTRRWGQWRIVLDLALEAAGHMSDTLEVARIRHQLGSRHLALGHLADAKADLEQALAARMALGAEAAAELTRHNLSLLLPPPPPPDSGGEHGTEPARRAGPGDRPAPPGPRSHPWLWATLATAGVVALLLGAAVAVGVIPPRDPAVLVAEPVSLAFGDVQVGDVSETRSVTIANDGGQSTMLDVGLEPLGDFSVSSCPRELGPGESCRLGVEFRPTLVGPRTATLVIDSDASGAAPTIRLTGVGVAPPLGPAIDIRPRDLDFGEVAIGDRSTEQTLTVVSGGDQPLELGPLLLDDGPFRIIEDACGGRSLDATETCSIRVAFEPDGLGLQTQRLQVASNALGSPHEIALAGTGTGEARLVLPESFDLGDAVPGQGVSKDLRVANEGTGPLTIERVRITTEPGSAALDVPFDRFEPSFDGCSTVTVDPGSACTIGLTFTPSVFGPHRAVLEILHDAATEPTQVLLTGRGYDGAADLSGKGALDGQLGYVDEDGDGFFAEDIVILISNDGPGTAAVFKIASRFVSNDDDVEVQVVPTTADDLRADGLYLFTTRPLGAGQLLEFSARVLIPTSFDNDGGDLIVDLDSCIGEVVDSQTCRVPEVDEGNNRFEVEFPAGVD